MPKAVMGSVSITKMIQEHLMPYEKGRPRAAEPGNRPDAESATATASISQASVITPQVKRSFRPGMHQVTIVVARVYGNPEAGA